MVLFTFFFLRVLLNICLKFADYFDGDCYHDVFIGGAEIGGQGGTERTKLVFGAVPKREYNIGSNFFFSFKSYRDMLPNFENCVRVLKNC